MFCTFQGSYIKGDDQTASTQADLHLCYSKATIDTRLLCGDAHMPYIYTTINAFFTFYTSSSFQSAHKTLVFNTYSAQRQHVNVYGSMMAN